MRKKHCDRPVPTTRPSIGRTPHRSRHRVLPWRTVCFGLMSGAGVAQPDPIFDVIVRRWQTWSGEQAVLVGEGVASERKIEKTLTSRGSGSF